MTIRVKLTALLLVITVAPLLLLAWSDRNAEIELAERLAAGATTNVIHDDGIGCECTHKIIIIIVVQQEEKKEKECQCAFFIIKSITTATAATAASITGVATTQCQKGCPRIQNTRQTSH